ncbi:hypothetical protein [Aquipuribacter nitratireducens]|uniref:DUF559 domain-containing protein n=1 Tax=Aquipuribacter nitratireducens TaxID=650104 RepID=A0ABW0GR11_9MICO
MPLPPHHVVAALGGVASYRRVVAVCGRHALRRAVAGGQILRLGRNRYGLPGLDAQLAAAHGHRACLSHLSAAVHHGWGVLDPPRDLWLTLPRGHKHAPRAGTVWSAATLSDAEVAAGVTSPARTVLDCARSLPFAAALAVADSALRSGAVTPEELVELAQATRAPGVVAARSVVAHADGRAANPFESGLRAIVLEVGLRGFVPQLVVTGPGLFACVDLGDPERKVAFEADGYGVHGTRRAFAHDLARHDDLQSDGWVTRRFAFEHVFRRRGWVARQVLTAAAQRVVPAPRRHRTRVNGARKAS